MDSVDSEVTRVPVGSSGWIGTWHSYGRMRRPAELNEACVFNVQVECCYDDDDEEPNWKEPQNLKG
jgi:hypothetical protein